MRVALFLVFWIAFPASSPAFGPFRRKRSSKPNPNFLFDALNSRRDATLSSEEFAVFLEPDRFRSRILRQVRYKMGVFGKLPGMKGILASSGKEPPFAKKNHAAWVETFDRNADGALNQAEREIAVPEIFSEADENGDGNLTRREFSDFLKGRRKLLEGSVPDSAPTTGSP